MKRIFILALSLVLLFGCASAPPQKSAQGRKVSNSWQWFAFASTSKLAEGMTLQEVKAVFPFPKATNRSVSGGRVRLQIVFEQVKTKRIYLYFDDNILTGWQE
jgi:hypothetical protein